MAHYIVTFRIASDSTYQQRYESFLKGAADIVGGHWNMWAETTSFLAFESGFSTETVCHKLWFNTDFDDTKDEMIVINLNQRDKAVKGPIKYPAILSSALGF